MRALDHQRREGYLAAWREINRRAKYPPRPKAPWYRVLVFMVWNLMRMAKQKREAA